MTCLRGLVVKRSQAAVQYKPGWLFGRAWVRIPPLPACRVWFLHEIILGQGRYCVLVKL